MREMKRRFGGYQWQPKQAPQDVVYHPRAVLSFLTGYESKVPSDWCQSHMATPRSTLDTLTLNAPAILSKASYPWKELDSPWMTRRVGSSTEWHKVGPGLRRRL